MKWIPAVLMNGLVLLACAPRVPETCGGRPSAVVFEDSFEAAELDREKWQITSANDFREKVVDLFDRSADTTAFDRQLRLRADTVDTSGDTIKYLGIVSTRSVDLSERKRIELDLDWNRQTNGSYLSAGIYLAPTITSLIPKSERDWVNFEYIGVPPGRNARSVVSTQSNGAFRTLFNEGWPHEQRDGRYIDKQRLIIFLDTQSIRVLENGSLLFEAEDLDLPFSSAYIYLQMSSHSNYPAREVFFDNLRVASCKGS